jgi:hypothetical protein
MTPIYNEIYKKAKSTFKYNLDDKNVFKNEKGTFDDTKWNEWVQHWFKTADELYLDLVEEKLQTTAEYVKELIELNKRYYFK